MDEKIIYSFCFLNFLSIISRAFALFNRMVVFLICTGKKKIAKYLKGEWPEKDEILLPDYVVLSIVKLHFLLGGHQFFFRSTI